MKLLTSLTIMIALATPLLAQTPTLSLEAQVKRELNEAARNYREGKLATSTRRQYFNA